MKCLIFRANTPDEAKSLAESKLQENIGIAHGFYVTKVEELKLYEIALRSLRGEKDTTQYPEDWVFLPAKERFYAATLEEAQEIAKTRERAFNPEWGGTMLDREPTEVKE